jgi:hypothetical protein
MSISGYLKVLVTKHLHKSQSCVYEINENWEEWGMVNEKNLSSFRKYISRQK